jgi:hypothetical protein
MKKIPLILSCFGAIAFGTLAACEFYSPLAPHYRTVEHVHGGVYRQDAEPAGCSEPRDRVTGAFGVALARGH